MKTMLVSLAAATCLSAGACGDSERGVAAKTAPSADTTAAAPSTTPPAIADGVVVVTLNEWALDTGKTLPAGKVSFALKNTGQYPHEVAVIKGTFAELPRLDGGAVAEDRLAVGAFIGRSPKVAPASEGTAQFDLPAGAYVFVCNIGNGPTSHAAKGQYLDVNVG